MAKSATTSPFFIIEESRVRTQIPGKQILDLGVETEDLKDGAVTDLKLSSTGVVGGTYTKVTVNDKGRVVAAESPTTLAGYGITDAVGAAEDNSIITAVVEPDRPASRLLTVSANQLVKLDGGAGTTFNLGLADNVILPGTGALTLVSGTTAQRPASPNTAQVRYNSDLDALEIYTTDWTEIVMDDDKRFYTPNTLIVSLDPGKGQFASVKAAVESIVDADLTNRYVVKIMGGTYNEAPFAMKRYVSIVGDSSSSTRLLATDPDSNFITGANDSGIRGVTISGATNAAGIYFQDAPENVSTRNMIVSGVRFGSNNTAIHCVSTGMSTSVFAVDCYFGGSTSYDKALVAESSGGGQARILVRASTTQGSTAPAPTEFAYATGTGAEIFLNGVQTRISIGMPAGVGIRVNNGATARLLSATFRGYATAIYAENSGTAPAIFAYNVGLESNTVDINIEHAGTTGVFNGNAAKSKVISASPNISIMYLDPSVQGVNIVGRFNLGATQALLTDVTDLILETPPMGLLSGGALSPAGGLNVTVAAGVGYLDKDGATTRVTWASGSVTVPANTATYIWINKNGVITQGSTEPDGATNILLGRVGSGASSLTALGMLSTYIANHGNAVENFLRSTVGPVYESGSIVSENATTPRTLDVTAGTWFFGTIKRSPSAKTAPTIQIGHRTGGVTVVTPSATVPNDSYDDGTDLVPLTAGYYTKHALYQAGEGAFQGLLLAHGQAEYATLDEARLAPLPIPRISPDATPEIAAIIVQQGTNNIVEIQDIRPMFFRAGGSSISGGTSDHGDLIGLTDDDHPQYLLTNGSRAFTGDVSLGTNDLTNVGLINGLDITNFGERLTPNGVDPIPTAAAVSLSNVTTNTEGMTDFLARADHTHAITGFQPSSTELTQVAALNSNGVVVHVEPNSWTTRTLTAVDGHIVITNGNGVAGNPTFELGDVGTPGTYVSVTTDGHGRVTAGSTTQAWSTITGTPTTLTGYGITDAQPLDTDLTALASSAGIGFYIRTGDGTSVTRSFTLPAAGLTLTSPDGVAGTPTFALANDLAAVEGLATTGLATRTGTDTWTTRSLVAPAAGFTITNNTAVAGNPTFVLSNDLAAVEALATNGIAVRTGTSTWATRTLASTTLTLATADGIAGNPTINLTTVGTAGTYHSVTTDVYGRVTAGTNPTTLAGHGITDAVNVALLGANSGVATLDPTGKLTQAQIPAIAISDTFVVASQAAMLALTAEVGDVAVRTDLNKTFILRLDGASTLGNWQELLTPTDAVSSVNGQTGTVTLNFVTSVATTQPAAGLTITGGPITSTGTLTFALANDLAALEGLGGTGIAVRTAADTWAQRTITAGNAGLTITNGDGVAGNPTITLPTVGSAGTYRSVTTDVYGRVTAGTNPTTLAGYGITDAQPLDVDLTALANTATNGFYVRTGNGTSITRAFVAPAAGLTLTNADGVAGVPTFALANDLAAVEALAANGIAVRSGTDTWNVRSLVAPAAGFSITNAGGVAGDPTFNLTNDLAAVEGLTTTGFAVRTAADTWATRSFVAGSGITLSNTDGIAGNITISAAAAATNLDALTDVVITAPTTGQILSYNGTTWLNTTTAAGAATALLSAWTLVSGTRYYSDFAHNLGTNNIVITLYDTADNSVVTADSIVLTNTNTARVTVIGNSRTLRAVAVANGLAINTATQSAGTITTAKDGVNVSAAASRLNFTGQAVSVTDAGAGTTNVVFGSRFTFFASSLDTPTNADWAVNALAPTVTDPSFTALTVRQFSNTVEQGVGFLMSVPTGATSATFKFRGRPTTAPGAASVVGMRMYARLIPNNSAVGAWSAVREIGEIAIPANAFFQYSTFTISLATLGLAAGNMYQIELTRRVAGTTGTNLANAFLLAEVTVEVA